MDAYEARKELRKQRAQNMRNFFMKDPLGLLAEAQALHIPLSHTFHCAGPSLKHSRGPLVLTDAQREVLDEAAATMAEHYAADYDRAVERNLKLTGQAYSGD